MPHFSYIPILAVVGSIFAIVFAAVDKFIAKIKDAKKRKYVKYTIYTALFFCMGCISTEVVAFCK